MSEPAPLPPLPQPFANAPRQLAAGGGGCSRGAMIGCGILIALFGIGAIALSMKADEMLVYVLQRLQVKVEQHLPADVTPGDRERLTAAFDDFYRAIDEGRMDPVAMQALQRQLFGLAEGLEKGLSRQQVLELTAALEKAAGKADAEPAASPSPDGAGESEPMGPPLAPTAADAEPQPETTRTDVPQGSMPNGSMPNGSTATEPAATPAPLPSA